MTASEPEGALIEISVYSLESEEHTFLQVYEVLSASADSRSLYVDVVPRDAKFEAITDLVDVTRQMEVDDAGIRQHLNGHSNNERVIKIYALTDAFGPVVVQYDPCHEYDSHPVTVLLGADYLGIPLELLDNIDKGRAFQLGHRARALFFEISDRTDALYGQLTIEHPFPAPQSLMDGSGAFGGAIYLSNSLMQTDSQLVPWLRAEYEYEVVQTLAKGIYISGWAPFNAGDVSIERSNELEEFISEFVGRQLRDIRADSN